MGNKWRYILPWLLLLQLQAFGQSDSLRVPGTLDSLQLRLEAKLDSLNRLDSLTSGLLARRDSLIKKLEAHKALMVDSTLQKGRQRWERSTKGLSGKLDSVRQLAPDVPMDQFNLPKEEVSLPSPKAGAGSISLAQSGEMPAIPSTSPAAEDVKAISEHAAGYQSSSSEYLGMLDSLRSMDKADLDTLAREYGQKGIKTLESELVSQKELTALGGEGDLSSAYMEEALASDDMTDAALAKKMDFKKLQKDHFPDKSKLEQGREEVGKLKKKYSALQDSRKKDLGIKKHSLKERPFWQRWEYGLEANARSFDPFSLEVSPFAGFRLEKRWSIGLGMLISGQKNASKDMQVALDGGRLYSLFRLGKSIYALGEYQHRNWLKTEQLNERMKSNLFLIGMGTEFSVFGKCSIRSSVKYTLNKKSIQNQALNSPWQATIGIVRFRK